MNRSVGWKKRLYRPDAELAELIRDTPLSRERDELLRSGAGTRKVISSTLLAQLPELGMPIASRSLHWPGWYHLMRRRRHPRKLKTGGGGGIRTHERLAPLPIFKTGAFNRSATPPSFIFKHLHHLWAGTI